MSELFLNLYKKMYLIRCAEKYIQREYPNDEMKTPMHMSMGEEAIVVGITHALQGRGLFYGTYRNHALYLAVTGETDQFFAELYGKKSGVSGGKAGSMHLACPEKGLMLTSAVVGTTIPVAVGSALASKMRKDGKISISFFGDGAVDEGVFWESLNAACLWKLPVLFVCEDNGLAILTSTAKRRGYRSLTKIVSGFNCLVMESDTTDVKEIYNLAQVSIDHIHSENRPVFLNLRYYRYLDHVGIKTDFHYGYRSEDEFKKWLKRDPLKIQKEFLIRTLAAEDEVLKLEAEIDKQIQQSINLAKLAPFPEMKQLHRGVFYD